MPTLQNDYRPRAYQLPLLKALDNGTKYAAIIWARRHGKDLTCWNYAIGRAATEVIDVTYVYPTSDMGKKNLWKAKTNDGAKFTDFIPKELRRLRHRNDDGLNDSDKSVELYNGSIIRLETGENADRLRGANSKLYVLSEFAEMDPAVLDVIEPVVEANGGQILVNFTPKGNNHAKGAWDSWVADPEWFTQMITARDTDVFTTDQLDRIKRRLIERFKQQGRSEVEAVAYFDQEYLCSFDAPIIGSYYGEGMKQATVDKRITNVPYDAALPVHTFWDLGVGDSTAIWFVQAVGQEFRLIDYLESSGEGLTYYIRELQARNYVYGNHWAPHDIEVREMSSGKSRLEIARSLGINFRVVPRLSLDDGINAARMVLNRCWFDATKCDRGIMALQNYHKDWDDKNKTFKNHPKHDWSSHGSDAFRYFAIGFKQTVSAPQVTENIFDDDGFMV